ncbi:hypothetical protein BH23PLA1_BH23PLA1_07700 [soil metagenome]
MQTVESFKTTNRPPDSNRMRVLCAIPSTNQMYSGVGRALRELSARMVGRVDLEFAVDDLNPRNLGLLQAFAVEHGMRVHVGRHRLDPSSCDPVNEALPGVMAQRRWDAIELIGFANAATGDAVLEGVGNALLCYTPHDQPLWTVPMSAEQASRTAEVHRRVVQRADVVLADSPHERRQLQALAPGRNHCNFLPLGCDFDAFTPGPIDRPPRFLFVGDLNEIRKRFDRVLGVFSRLRETRPDLRLVVVGNRSEEAGAGLPGSLRSAVDLRGYIDESELRKTYSESLGLFLLSDVEAFGLPILEALASGTPVFLSDLETTRGLFGAFRGACFCPTDDPEGTFAVVERSLSRGREAIAETIADRPRLQAAFDWNQLAVRKWQALASAWTRKQGWAWSA